MNGVEETIQPAGAERTLRWITVLSAAGLDYRLSRFGSQWVIHVPSAQVASARREIDLYETENADWPPAMAGTADGSPLYETWGAFWGIFLVLFFYLWLGPYQPGNAVLRAASNDVEAVLGGEWWRVVTALTVHSGPVHVTANAVAILLLGHAVCRLLGSGLAWLLILLAGAAGNGLVAVWAGVDHVSVGASTAVFGALGVLAGHRTGETRRHSVGLRELWRRAWLPLCAGLAFLGLFGTGPGTDLTAHAFGFALGAAAGFPFGRHGALRCPESVQRALRIFSIGIVIAAWACVIAVTSP